MQEYIYKLLDELPFDMDGISKTPAANQLFNVNDNSAAISPLNGKITIPMQKNKTGYTNSHGVLMH